MQPEDGFAVCAARHRVAGNNKASLFAAALGHDRYWLTDTDVRWRIHDSKMNQQSVVLQSAAEALICESYRLPAGCGCGRLGKRCRIDVAVNQRFYPEAVRIDNL